jgi:hypothetical protein
MKRLVSGILSSLVILSATIPTQAQTPNFTVAQSESAIEQLSKEQRVVTEGMLELMAQMKTMMAEMKALTAPSSGKPVTMNDLYKQQQVLSTQMDMLIGRTRLDTIQPREARSASVQEVQQQQQVMIAEMKNMMAEMQKMMAVYRGRATNLR